MKTKYYVYVYLDPRKPGKFIYGDYQFKHEPFYAGKGIGDRYLKHLCETSGTTSNILKYRVIRKIYSDDLEPIIVKVHENLNESDAYRLETNLIKLLGRRCDESGCLTNIVIDAKPPSNYIVLDKNIINKIIQLYNDGNYLSHIAKELGLDELKIKRVLIENGINPQRKPPANKLKINDSIINKMVSEYNSGKSIRKIMKIFNLSFEIVRRKLKEKNVVFRGYDYKKTKDHIDKIFRNRVVKYGEDHPSFKSLSNDDIIKLKRLRFEDKKSIREILKIMKINQQKYYYYINY